MSTLVVFRNNISHARFFEARSQLAALKVGLCIVGTLVATAPVDTPEALEAKIQRLDQNFQVITSAAREREYRARN